ncbi:unnamed protein product [Fraxinus pennsylvanica]|uniref:Peptidase M16 C-terminal domain-containing protein n=1 Tax=Fraxinus pennsylvanica TaxID=56036 RepID=A0AAD1ZMX8_9LAMI|nr:unnamed protein product [Fraxinus pennsylvanica]
MRCSLKPLWTWKLNRPWVLMIRIPATSLRKILLGSGLVDAIIGGGVEDELLQPQFSIGLKGVSEDDIHKVEELIMNTLRKLADEGFDSDAVEASMNTVEFSLRENNIGSFPRGLALMLRSMGKWIYDKDPFGPLKYQKPLNDLKARIAQEESKAVFAPLIEEFILNSSLKSYPEFLQDLEEKVYKNWQEISSSLEEIRIYQNGCLINLMADGKNLGNSEKHVRKFLDMLLNSFPVGSAAWSARLPLINEAILVPTQASKHSIFLGFHLYAFLSQFH